MNENTVEIDQSVLETLKNEAEVVVDSICDDEWHEEHGATVKEAICKADAVVRENRKTDVKPLDPNEGPTIWVVSEINNHLYRIIEGRDPENPINETVLSESEIDRLAGIAGEDHDTDTIVELANEGLDALAFGELDDAEEALRGILNEVDDGPWMGEEA